jgi:uncharacterized protein (DUF983 family)
MKIPEENLVGKNISAPIKRIRHSELVRVGDSAYRSECPECGEGVLLVARDPKNNYELSAYDRCVLCGQQFEYVDIDEMRKNK